MKPSIKKKDCLRHQAVHEGDLNMDRQVCVIKIMAYRVWAETRTDKSLKEPKILSNDIFYFRTVIIGGPIYKTNCNQIVT